MLFSINFKQSCISRQLVLNSTSTSRLRGMKMYVSAYSCKAQDAEGETPSKIRRLVTIRVRGHVWGALVIDVRNFSSEYCASCHVTSDANDSKIGRSQSYFRESLIWNYSGGTRYDSGKDFRWISNARSVFLNQRRLISRGGMLCYLGLNCTTWRYLTRLRQHLRNFRNLSAGRYIYASRTTPLWSGKVKQSNNHAHRVVDSRHTFGRNTSPSSCKANNLSW